MEAAGETCKLCLKYIQGASLAVLDDKLLGKLEFLQMNLDQSVEESNSICKECEEKIENAFDFKSCLVDVETSGSKDKPVISDIPSTSSGETSAEKTVCHLCKNSVDIISVISFPKLLKDDSMMEVFQGHIPEVDLKDTENSMVCESCQKSLASFSTLVASWSIANDWNEEDMKDDIDDFEMMQVKKEDDFSDSNTNSSLVSDSVNISKKGKGKKIPSSTIVKSEIDEISDSSESVSVTSKNVKQEDAEEEDEDAEMEDLQLKSEEVDIKDEDGKFKNATRITNITKDKTNSTYTAKRTFDCDKCPYKAEKYRRLREHSLTHMSFEERKKMEAHLPIFQCTDCPYKTFVSTSMKRHVVIHKSMEERQKIKEEMPEFECHHCKFTTKFKKNFIGHLNIHKPPEERQKIKEQKLIYGCQKCGYKSSRRSRLKAHSFIHVSAEERRKLNDQLPKLNCQLCAYATHNKRNLTRHFSKHHANVKNL